MLLISKLSEIDKKFIMNKILKNLETGDFYDFKAKENCVDDIVLIMLQEIQSLIMDKHGCKNLKRSRELDLHGVFEAEEDREEVGRVEFLIFGNEKKEEISDSLHYPILVVENKRPTLNHNVGLNQCLLALYTMDKHCNSQFEVYGIIFNGYFWQLIKHKSTNKTITISKPYSFIPENLEKLGLERLLEDTLLLDVIYTIILNFLKIKA